MDWWPCQLSIFIGALLFRGPVAAEGKPRTEQLDLFTSLLLRKKHI